VAFFSPPGNYARLPGNCAAFDRGAGAEQSLQPTPPFV
jgi:hypothetical protein